MTAAQRPPIPPEKFAVLGFGRFGQAFAGLLMRAGHSVRAWDPRGHIPVELAARSGRTAIEGAQWVVLAMPVSRMRSALRVLRPYLHGGQIVIDVGSVKTLPCSIMKELLGMDIPHVGTHPLFGPLSLAREEQPLRAVICAARGHPQAAKRTRKLFEDLGCEVMQRDPASHDRAMANTHALAFFVAKGLIEMGADEDTRVVPPSFQGMQQMLAAVRGDAGHLFTAIQQENPFAAEARTRLLKELERIHRQLLDHEDEAGLAIAAPDLSPP